MNNRYEIGDRTPQSPHTASITQAMLLDSLYEELDELQASLGAKVHLYCELYLTPTQYRRWIKYFTMGDIKKVAIDEGVTPTAIAKSIKGTRPNESSASRLKSPIAKIQEIINADVEVISILAEIRRIQGDINDIASNTY